MRMYDLITKKKHGEALTDAEIKFMFHRGYKQDLNTTNDISDVSNADGYLV